MSLTDSMPIYVTRESPTGDYGTLAMSIWMALLAMFLIWVNVIVWSVVGLVVAVEVIA